ncbi:MAG: twin-arginine translocase TatA/TatE family subunit [Actinomycetota bacterium]|nr:twin-arginine translocase TatA/TatE family subunit [Actinomycetota bacterium]
MLDLSLTKLVIVLVVMVALLGPKRVPQVAGQLGAALRKAREVHQQIDRELRQTIPDLPSGQDIARFARSPITLLNQLADLPTGSKASLVEDRPVTHDVGAVDSVTGHDSPGALTGTADVPEEIDRRTARRTPSELSAGVGADDPNLN